MNNEINIKKMMCEQYVIISVDSEKKICDEIPYVSMEQNTLQTWKGRNLSNSNYM